MPGGDYFVWYVSFCTGGERGETRVEKFKGVECELRDLV